MVHIPGRSPSREARPGREQRGGHTMFLSAIAPGIPMNPGRFPVGVCPSWEAGLISMARNALKNMVWPPRSLPGRASLDGLLPGI